MFVYLSLAAATSHALPRITEHCGPRMVRSKRLAIDTRHDGTPAMDDGTRGPGPELGKDPIAMICSRT